MDFFCKLVAPRPTFGQDMTPDEGQLMQRHAIYWKQLMDRGHVVTFGVVADPREVFGIAVVSFESEAEVRRESAGARIRLHIAGFRWRFADGRRSRCGPVRRTPA